MKCLTKQLLAQYTNSQEKVFEQIEFVISTGKEGNVFRGNSKTITMQ